MKSVIDRLRGADILWEGGTAHGIENNRDHQFYCEKHSAPPHPRMWHHVRAGVLGSLRKMGVSDRPSLSLHALIWNPQLLHNC